LARKDSLTTWLTELARIVSNSGRPPIKTVIVTPEVPVKAGGIGAFTWNLAKLLRGAGDQVEVVLTAPLPAEKLPWKEPFKALGVSVKYLHDAPLTVPKGYSWHLKVAEETAAAIDPHADVVYFADWQANGVHFMRTRRFRSETTPAAVTVLHSPSSWLREAMRILPHSKEDLWLDFSEAYAVQHSDFVVAPGSYMLDWVRLNGWTLPPENRIAVCGLPYFPAAQEPTRTKAYIASMRQKVESSQKDAVVASRAGSARRGIAKGAGGFSRLVFFGRLETRKGLELFVDAVTALKDTQALTHVSEIVLLGGGAANRIGSPNDVAHALVAAVPHLRVVPLSNLNPFEAQAYLTEHAHDSLVVIPSRQENYPMAVIEASLIPGLNILCSDVGSISEILGPGSESQLFEPFARSLANKLESTLIAGPRPAAELHAYQWQAANERWLTLHERVCRSRKEVAGTPTNFAVPVLQPLTQTQAIATGVETHDDVSHSYGAIGERNDVADGNGSGLSGEHNGGFVSQRELAALPTTIGSARSVDVCVTYYNLGSYLPYLLESLARQTSQDFNLFVVDDGSTDSPSIQVFEQMRLKYQRPHWHFVRIENSGLSAARNQAAALGHGEYLMFVDADNVAPPQMVERFLSAMRISGDDCLTSYLLQFDREGWADSYIHSPLYLYAPAGNSSLLGLIANEFGDANCIVRRSVFETIGGFSTDLHKSLTGEDWEFFARLSLAGYRLDVIPEFLSYYRFRDNSLIRSTEMYLNYMRVLRVYEERFGTAGVPGLARYVAGAYNQVLGQQGSALGEIGLWNLVYHTSGYEILKALRLKVRNQIAKRFGRPLKP